MKMSLMSLSLQTLPQYCFLTTRSKWLCVSGWVRPPLWCSLPCFLWPQREQEAGHAPLDLRKKQDRRVDIVHGFSQWGRLQIVLLTQIQKRQLAVHGVRSLFSALGFPPTVQRSAPEVNTSVSVSLHVWCSLGKDTLPSQPPKLWTE